MSKITSNELQDSHSEAAFLDLCWMFFATLRRMSHRMELHSKDLERQFGLTVAQLNVLWIIGTEGTIAIGKLARHASVSSATVTSIVDRLEAHELVTRTRSSQDKRQVDVSMTDAGLATLESGPQPFDEHFRSQLRALPGWQRTELLSTMQRIAAMMDGGA